MNTSDSDFTKFIEYLTKYGSKPIELASGLKISEQSFNAFKQALLTDERLSQAFEDLWTFYLLSK